MKVNRGRRALWKMLALSHGVGSGRVEGGVMDSIGVGGNSEPGGKQPQTSVCEETRIDVRRN
jgi:hypothetical protein